MEKTINLKSHRREAIPKLRALEAKKNPPKPKKQRKPRKKKVVEEDE